MVGIFCHYFNSRCYNVCHIIQQLFSLSQLWFVDSSLQVWENILRLLYVCNEQLYLSILVFFGYLQILVYRFGRVHTFCRRIRRQQQSPRSIFEMLLSLNLAAAMSLDLATKKRRQKKLQLSRNWATATWFGNKKVRTPSWRRDVAVARFGNRRRDR